MKRIKFVFFVFVCLAAARMPAIKAQVTERPQFRVDPSGGSLISPILITGTARTRVAAFKLQTENAAPKVTKLVLYANQLADGLTNAEFRLNGSPIGRPIGEIAGDMEYEAATNFLLANNSIHLVEVYAGLPVNTNAKGKLFVLKRVEFVGLNGQAESLGADLESDPVRQGSPAAISIKEVRTPNLDFGDYTIVPVSMLEITNHGDENAYITSAKFIIQSKTGGQFNYYGNFRLALGEALIDSRQSWEEVGPLNGKYSTSFSFVVTVPAHSAIRLNLYANCEFVPLKQENGFPLVSFDVTIEGYGGSSNIAVVGRTQPPPPGTRPRRQ